MLGLRYDGNFGSDGNGDGEVVMAVVVLVMGCKTFENLALLLWVAVRRKMATKQHTVQMHIEKR